MHHTIWTNKKISYVGILIAASVVFVLVGSMLFAITALPSFKIAFGGVPVKITGFIFGPLVGALTGVIADLLSFVYLPTYYHVGYTLMMGLAGFIPGIIKMAFHKRRSVNFHFYSALISVIIVGVGFFLAVVFMPESAFSGNRFINGRTIYEILIIVGFVAFTIVTIVIRFKAKEENIRGLFQIIIFTALLEVLNVTIAPIWDVFTLGLTYIFSFTVRILSTPIKLIFNAFVIYLTWKIVNPLINSRSENSYYSSFSKKEKLQRIYLCGPTVYDNVHLGNLRPVIVSDFYIRSLKFFEEDYHYIQNITDVDDKIISKAQSLNQSEESISSHYYQKYLEILKETNVVFPSEFVKVTDNISSIIDFIQKQIDSKAAYVSDDKDVLFEIEKSPVYGSISNQNLKKLTHKKSFEHNFRLWKSTNNGINWDSPWSKGRPGWHTECAFFIYHYFKGKRLDLHAGGVDLKFPHHENENAQFYALTKKSISKKWLHVGQVNFNQQKMSKSLKNVIYAEDFLKNYSANLLRFIYLSTNPFGPLTIDSNFFNSKQNELQKIINLLQKHHFYLQDQEYLNKFKNSYYLEGIFSLIKKFEFAKANAKIWKLIALFQRENDDTAKKELFFSLNLLLKELGFNFNFGNWTPKNMKQYQMWQKALKEKNFTEADKMRDNLISKKLI